MKIEFRIFEKYVIHPTVEVYFDTPFKTSDLCLHCPNW